MIDLYSFQRRPDIVKSFGHSGSYTPSWSAARRQAIADDGDEDWWNTISPAYEWMMGEMEHAGMPRPDPDAAPLWAWALGRFERQGAYASRPTVSRLPQPVRRVGSPASAGR
ncbi:hypothetical protein [Bifidobacterium longum]|uniref:hypothetical protein n=1 Tax=Bifidobacterium longum TaxID=216816 RepID=UPI002E797D7B|nr:hypothetical protein [Bifidobacterium longum]